jgi:uncharacterized membrane protein YccF (DUF307 family)
MSEPGGPETRVEQRPLVVRAVWFLLVGWWATGIWLSVAWVLNVTIVGIPLGIKMINLVPLVVSLKRRRGTLVSVDGRVETRHSDQHGLLVRGLWFVFVGWWASAIWMGVAYLLTVSIVGLPLAVWMYDRLPFVVSLYRY